MLLVANTLQGMLFPGTNIFVGHQQSIRKDTILIRPLLEVELRYVVVILAQLLHHRFLLVELISPGLTMKVLET
ncbi:hypothetical protein D3C85_1850060 [compost metagenome]